MALRYFRYIWLILPFIQPHKIWLRGADAQQIIFASGVLSDDVEEPEIAKTLRQVAPKFMRNLPKGLSPAFFVWQPSTSVSDPSNWLDDEPACDGDRMRIEPDKIFIGYLNDKLSVSTLDLPEDGVLYFGDKPAVLGDKGDWQCDKHEDAEDAFFQPFDKEEPNFFDSKNWRIFDVEFGGATLRERTHTRLNAEMVPGDMDYVIIPNISQIFLDDPAVAGSFVMDEKVYDTSQLFAAMQTMEGQLRFRLGHRLADKINVDGVEFTRPNKHAIDVGRQRPGDTSIVPFYLPQLYLSRICERIACPPVDAVCETPIRPAGQCCWQCGAMATFRQKALDESRALAVVRAVEMELENGVGLSFVRVDFASFYAYYQLAVITPAGTPYDESLSYAALFDAFNRVQDDATKNPPEGGKPVGDYYQLNVVYSIERRKIHIGKLLRNMALMLPLVLLLLMAFYQQYRRSPRLRMWWRDRRAPSLAGLSVTWQRARELVELRSGADASPRRLFSRRGASTVQTEFPNAAFCNVSYEESEACGEKNLATETPTAGKPAGTSAPEESQKLIIDFL